MFSLLSWFKNRTSKTAVQCYNDALEQFAHKNYSACVDLLNRCLQKDPNFADAHFNLACAYFQIDQKNQAVPHLEKVLALKPNDKDALYNLALIQMDEKNWVLAKANLEKVVAVEPNDADALLGLGICAVEEEQPEQAKGFFESAVAIQPDLPLAHLHLGKLYMQDGLDNTQQINQALAHYQKALPAFQDNTDLHLDMSLLAAKLNNWTLALDHALLCVSCQPDNSKGYNQLGLALYCQQQFEESIVHFRNALAIDPNYFTVYNNLSFAYEKNNQLDEALNALHQYLAYVDDPQERQITEEHMKDLLKKGAKP